MGNNIKDIMSDLKELNTSLKKIIYNSKYELYDDLSGLEYDKSDADELFLLDELQLILSKIDNVSQTLNYLEKPIKVEGKLHKNSNGRYEVKGIELSSGYGIEYLTTDDWHMRYDDNDNYVTTPYWKSSRIEHDGTDYYIVGADYLDTLENVLVRIR